MKYQLDCEGYIIDILESINAKKGDRFFYAGVQTIAAAESKTNDSPGIYLVRGKNALDDAILKVSNKKFPDSVAIEVQKTRLARSALSEDFAVVIPNPITEGRFFSQSYAIWPRYRDISGNKIIRAIQKRLLRDKLFAWLRGAANVSLNRNLSDDDIHRWRRLPLEHICNNNRLSAGTRSIAKRALQRLDDGQWRPVSILQQTDFYLGNILLPRFMQSYENNKFRFFVIDWGGSYIKGAPGFDLIVLCQSINVSLERAYKEILTYISSIHISSEDFVAELIAALGLIGLDLNQLPESRYLALCERTIDYVRAVGLIDSSSVTRPSRITAAAS